MFIRSNPVDCCVFLTGLFRDAASGVVEGTCGPVLIHADKSKTKEKEAQERVRQRNGEAPDNMVTSERWTVELENIPDIRVQTTNSGSMTQEVFFVYAKHFVEALPSEHGPVILFLDGHGSRWNQEALQFLMQNRVFPFILASHTSIWSQPNDAGVNKRLHCSIEEECKKVRRTTEHSNIRYFNSNFVKGWHTFLKAERDDLHRVGVNNTTRAFERTGLFPFNPFSESWTNAINTLGQGQMPNAGAQYEIYPNENAEQLTVAESALLRNGMQNCTLKRDLEVAFIRGAHILSHWREDILTGVSEGETYDTYSHTLLPSAKNESEMLAMRLIHFEKIQGSQLCPALTVKTKEEQSAEITRCIVYSTKKLDPIFVTYLSESESDENTESAESDTTSKDLSKTSSKTNGTAVKVDTNKWKIHLDNNVSMTVTDEDLIDGNKFYIEQKWLRVDDKDDMKKKKQDAKRKRARKAEQVSKEKRIREQGLEKLRELELKEYNNLREKFESGEGYRFEEFLDMIDRMRKPFVAQVEGHEVSLSQDDCAIMMETSVVRSITNSLFLVKDMQDKTSQNKRQRTNNATVRTECGATGTIALYQTEQRNTRLSRQAIKKSIDKLERERKNISTTLTLLAALKQKRPDAYWIFTSQSSQSELSMLLRLLAPQSGMISKGKQAMWRYVEDNLLPMLSQAAVDAKGEEYARRLATVAVAAAALQEQEQQLQNLPVETTEDDGSPDDPPEDTID